jgi:long-chain fatty acid transport protein
VLFETAPGTSIGLGYRSQFSHDLNDDIRFLGGANQGGAGAELNLPDILTLSIRQAIAPNMRLLGTIEWPNWSRFHELQLTCTVPAIPAISANWSDGWFFSLGGEYDLNPGKTLRAGVA